MPDDVLITNDPWIGTGHLNDINIAVPVFHRDRLIAFAASTAHSPDIGGRLRSPDNHEVFEEGLRIPMAKLIEAGRPNDLLFDVIRHNVRVPDQVVGDIEAQIAANTLAAKHLIELVEEYDIHDLGRLAGSSSGSRRRQPVPPSVRFRLASIPTRSRSTAWEKIW